MLKEKDLDTVLATTPGQCHALRMIAVKADADVCCQKPSVHNTATPPANLDYEMWTGPAPIRPYNPLAHPRSWQLFMEYCNGIVGDMCIHMFDMVRWMMDLGRPKRISSSGGILVQKEAKANTGTQTATFDYDELKIVWQHPTWGPPVHRDVTYELEQYPEDKTGKDLEKHVAPAIRYHMKDFLAAIDSRGKPVADIEGYISTARCILANQAMKLGRTLTWDPVKQRVVNDDEANRLLRRPYRQPWIHPEPEKV
jgi:hypothetical protein